MPPVGRYGKTWLPATSPCWFREADHGGDVLVETGDDQFPDEDDGILYCRSCHAPVTHDKERQTIDGKRYHVFANPDGMVFEIGCFGLAPGCLAQGVLTAKFSWFPPYAWSYALCRRCQSHLGWYYETVGRIPFFGLILTRLVGEAHKGV
jgi:hypothetical protein